MALYFFDIFDGERLPDRQGLELQSIADAQAHALEMTKSFLDQPACDVWRDNVWSVGIRDVNRGTLFRLDVKVSQTET